MVDSTIGQVISSRHIFLSPLCLKTLLQVHMAYRLKIFLHSESFKSFAFYSGLEHIDVPSDSKSSVVVVVTRQNMDKVFGKGTCALINSSAARNKLTLTKLISVSPESTWFFL